MVKVLFCLRELCFFSSLLIVLFHIFGIKVFYFVMYCVFVASRQWLWAKDSVTEIGMSLAECLQSWQVCRRKSGAHWCLIAELDFIWQPFAQWDTFKLSYYCNSSLKKVSWWSQEASFNCCSCDMCNCLNTLVFHKIYARWCNVFSYQCVTHTVHTHT